MNTSDPPLEALYIRNFTKIEKLAFQIGIQINIEPDETTFRAPLARM